MSDLRLMLRAFVSARFASARKELGFQPAVRVALDAGEAFSLGLVTTFCNWLGPSGDLVGSCETTADEAPTFGALPAGLAAWSIPERGTQTMYVVAVHDGDTVTACLLVPVTLRLNGINAPELATPTGPASRDALAGRVQNKLVTAALAGREKYGRTLAVLHLGDEAQSVNDWLIANGFAVAYDGHGPRLEGSC